jgi:hypothetical protein
MAEMRAGDAFEARLSQGLRAYANARVRAVDPVLVAAWAVAPPRPGWLPAARPRGLRLRVIALAFGAALLALAAASMLGGFGSPPPPSPTAIEASPPPVPFPTGRIDALLFGDWSLDFAASDLDPRPNKRLDMDIGSSIRFSHGGFSGGTGYAGGCSSYEGTFTESTASESVLSGRIRLAFTSVSQNCDAGSPGQILDGLVGARRFSLQDCTQTPGTSNPEQVTCGTLRLDGDFELVVLVYRHMTE